MTLANQLDAAEAEVSRLKRVIAQAKCREIGRHEWKSMGGTNAGCSPECTCSVPVYECARCGDCDYGDNDDAATTRAGCLAATEQKP